MNALDGTQPTESRETDTRALAEQPFRDYKNVHTDGTTSLENRCGNCGAHVTRDFHRIFANDDGTLHGCWECMTARNLSEGDPALGRDHRQGGSYDDE